MSNMAKPRFVFLLLREHPYGREMLRQLLSAGHSPVLIIEEDSPVADEEREKFGKDFHAKRFRVTNPSATEEEIT